MPVEDVFSRVQEIAALASRAGGDPSIARATVGAFPGLLAQASPQASGLEGPEGHQPDALPWLIDHVEEARREFGEDFWAYGLEPNRPAFEAIGRYVHEQGLSPRVVSADELFAPGVE